jgi:hypothetical protein
MAGSSLAEIRSAAFFRRLLGIGVALLLLWSIPTAARAERYRTEIVAQVGTVIDGYTITEIPWDGSFPDINDSGEVVFPARVIGPGGYDAYAVLTNRRLVSKTGDLIDGESQFLIDEVINPKINNHGQIAYQAAFGENYKAVLDGHIVAEPGMQFGDFVVGEVPNNFRLDDLGRVIFGSSTGHGGGAIYSQFGVLVGPGDEIDGYRILSAGGPVVSPNGTVGFRAHLEGVPASGQAIVTLDRVLLKAQDALDADRTIFGLGSIWITDSGQMLADITTRNSDFLVENLKLLLPGGLLTDEMVLGDLPPGHLLGAVAPPFPNGEFAFYATEPQGRYALFVGDQLVVAVGDTIDGRTISEMLGFNTNRRGDVAVNAGFTDGTYGVVLATVPEPTVWTLVGGGLLFAVILGAFR